MSWQPVQLNDLMSFFGTCVELAVTMTYLCAIPRGRAGPKLQAHIWVDHLGFQAIPGGAQCGARASYRTMALSSIVSLESV